MNSRQSDVLAGAPVDTPFVDWPLALGVIKSEAVQPGIRDAKTANPTQHTINNRHRV
jgi:hypothetical protein